jgi:integrase
MDGTAFHSSAERCAASANGSPDRYRWFDPALARIRAVDPDFPRITPHDLRDTAASLAIAVGANVKAVQRMLGHASAAMTLDVYTDLFDDDLDAVAAASMTTLRPQVWAKCG